MKKLIVAALLAGSFMALEAAETEAKAETNAEAAKTAQEAQTASRKSVSRRQFTDEQRAEMRAKREKAMAARRAKVQAEAIAIIRKYGLDDEKAKALFDELGKLLRPSRRPFGAKPQASGDNK